MLRHTGYSGFIIGTQDFQNIGRYMIKKSVISHNIMYYYLFIFYNT